MQKLTVFVTYNNDGEQGVGDDADESRERFTDNYSGPYRTVKVNLNVPEVPDVDAETEVTVPEAQATPVTAEAGNANEQD